MTSLTAIPGRPRPSAARRPTADQLLRRWRCYRASGDRAQRDELVFLLTPLVRHIVTCKIRQLPAYCEMDDLTAAGLEALVVSIDRYDPDKGATLEQFVWTRIHGAVLDELRRRDWAPRSLRRWERAAETSRRRLRAHLEREPTDDELAADLDSSAAEVRNRRDQLALAEIEPLATTVSGSDGVVFVDRAQTIEARDPMLNPEHAAAAAAAYERVAAALTSLPTREREVAQLLYVEELRLREIGELFGLSESRVCQIAGAMRKRLRVTLGADADLLDSLVD